MGAAVRVARLRGLHLGGDDGDSDPERGVGERAEELVDEAGVVGRLEGGRGEEDGVEGEVRRPREFLTERSLAVAAQGAGGGVGVDPRGGLAHHLRTPLR